ncbi:MAG: helix-turn-helix domain-containing protein [Anaerolineales bacterium]|nr:helix-turn-helix domain-containing protein [Anaerolineales bacterium]
MLRTSSKPYDKKKTSETKRQDATFVSEQVGKKVREFRKNQRLSIRELAGLSGLSINTLSLIENGKTSPSVTTLQQLARSLKISISEFFEGNKPQTEIVYQKASDRQKTSFPQGYIEKIETGISPTDYEPFIVRLELGANSGEAPVNFPCRQFIYCLEGHITYFIKNELYPLAPGDSLTFDAHIPHVWRNTASTGSSALFIVCPASVQEYGFEPIFHAMKL